MKKKLTQYQMVRNLLASQPDLTGKALAAKVQSVYGVTISRQTASKHRSSVYERCRIETGTQFQFEKLARLDAASLLQCIKELDTRVLTGLYRILYGMTDVPDMMEDIGRKHYRWIEGCSIETLEDLRQYLLEVRDEFLHFNGEDLLLAIIDELTIAADYLEDFDLDDPEDQDVDYRLANLEEDIAEVEELIEKVGDTFLLSKLPVWKPKRKAVA